MRGGARKREKAAPNGRLPRCNGKCSSLVIFPTTPREQLTKILNYMEIIDVLTTFATPVLTFLDVFLEFRALIAA